MGGSVNWDGVAVAFGVFAFFALVTFFTTPGLAARARDGILGALFQHRDIMKGDALYLRRYYITPRGWLGYDYARKRSRWPRALGWVPVRFRKIFLHHILLSDDRTPHDHPWDFTTRILAGEYIERIGTTRHRSRRGTPGTVLRNHAGHVHTLEIVRPVWSLVLAGPSRRVWGFWKDHTDGVTRWENWRSYLGCVRERTEPEDQIDPSIYPAAYSADFAFEMGDVARGNLAQPTAYWRDPRRVEGEWGEAIGAAEIECCPARCGGYCAIPIEISDDEPTRKVVVSIHGGH